MPEYVWMCPYKQDSEYASGLKYAIILNRVKLWIWQGALNMQALHSILTMAEYALTKLRCWVLGLGLNILNNAWLKMF